MKTEVKPTIAWLWDCFQKLGAYIETEKFLQSWGTKGSDGLSHDGRNHSADEIELQSLRQQLVERCNDVADENGWTLLFESMDAIIDGMQDGPMKDVYSPTAKGKIRIRCGRAIEPWFNVEGLREVSAIAGFWAWELQQREKEAANV